MMNNISKVFISIILPAVVCAAKEEAVQYRLVKHPRHIPDGYVWKSEVPEDCPFEKSELFDRIYITGEFSDYLTGDTFYPSWADDGNLYSPWTDGCTDDLISWSFSGRGEKATTGHAVMIGDDPLNLIITNPSPPKVASALPFQGRYPAGSLVHDGVWYYGTYCLTSGYSNQFANPKHNGFSYNWPVLGPLPGFQISHDYGRTWAPSPLTPADPLFPEPKKLGGAVKMGAPHFVDFGKNMQYSPDGKAYLVAMGAVDDDPKPRPCIKPKTGQAYEIAEQCPGDAGCKHANLSWISADQIYLARVTPSPETINDVNAYEFFGGHDAEGNPVWSRDFDDLKPLLEWNNNMGCVTVSYFPPLKKYIMCVTDGWPTVAEMDSYILEADELTGPWRIITYLENFGEQSYFLNFPSKFIGDDGKTAWLCHSANFSMGRNGHKFGVKPEGGRYGLSLHQIRFLSKGELVPEPVDKRDPDILEKSIAGTAQVSVSSTLPGTSAEAAVDGKIESEGWAALNENAGGWLKLKWEKKQTVGRIVLFNRFAGRGQVTSGLLLFSDGTFIHVDRSLPLFGYCYGLEISFEPRKVDWVKFIGLTSYRKSKTKTLGLSEIGVFAE
ncbi:discoidin domain-containing protein [Pontiella sulfatireligans]|uniref:DUF7402 domain-containing protein n=1 Tax=Pontiella sulfatireligans TaxID=2750658 RepID=A0A6C2UFY6_9BACT|nr:discoidin domain-containing protein [Pontiella sulfatireligans]VGO18829.1 hypothetical protein SCARR_00882 [Pontiella sulfatireligans]